MLIKQKNLRAYMRGWCRRRGVEFSSRTWLVRKLSERERLAERIMRPTRERLRPYQRAMLADLERHFSRSVAAGQCSPTLPKDP
jgi:hypothetical protein